MQEQLARPIIPTVVSQHVEDAASLRSVRTVLVRAPHVKLLHLGRTDERLLAHLDGISVAGAAGAAMAQQALEVPGVGQLFVATVGAIERRDQAQIARLLALMDAVPDTARAMASAFGWVSADALRGLTAPLLSSPTVTHRWLGLAACVAHGVNPGSILTSAVKDEDSRLRHQAVKAAARLGRTDLLADCAAGLKDESGPARLSCAQALLWLGDSSAAHPVLHEMALQADELALPALRCLLLSSSLGTARDFVRKLAGTGAPLRTLICAAAWAGDVQVVPWVIRHMADDKHARLAGEAFSFLTGADLALLDLERKPPEKVDGGPTDDPHDENVQLDEDESLPWPDIARVQAWWDANAARFPTGVRCFAGAVPDLAHCVHVLTEHPQRRRSAAAVLMRQMRPDSVLFNCAAPTRRQQRLLAEMRVQLQARSG